MFPPVGFASTTLFNISLSNFADTNGGILYYQIRYLKGGINYPIISKTTQKSFEITLPDLDEFYLDVFD